MSEELYKRFRPRKFGQVIGQESVVRTLTDFVDRDTIPHFLLFIGDSGCGKTTLARILKGMMEVQDADFKEMNCADFRGIDMVRDIRSQMLLAPIGGKAKIYLIDECHKLTSDAQDAFLKILEDTPKHVYFMLATTDPGKLKNTIRTRATELGVKSLCSNDMQVLLERVCKKIKIELTDDVEEKLIEAADGSARKALVILNAIMGLTEEHEQLEAIARGDAKTTAIEIARALIDPRTKWVDMAKILKQLNAKGDLANPEGIRYLILSYSMKVLLGGGKMAGRSALVIGEFRDNFYDSKVAGLILACYTVLE